MKKGKKKKPVPLKTTWLSSFKHRKADVELAKIKIGDKKFVYRFDDGYDPVYFKAKNVNEAKKKYRKYFPW